MRQLRPTLWCCWLAVLCAGWWIGAQGEANPSQAPGVAPAAAAPFAITHGPYLQLPTTTSVAIVWHTNRPAVSRVEYGLTDRLDAVAVASENGLIPNDRTSHVIRLTGLLPARSYKYRVVSREFVGYEKQHIVKYGETVASETLSFTTLDPRAGAFSFPLLSDIHENAARLERLLNTVDMGRTPFVVYDGDMVNDFMLPNQPFPAFVDTSVARFATHVPFIFVRGNHEVRGRYARRLSDYFPLQAGRAYYSFDSGAVHVIVLDSGEDKPDTHEYYNGLVDFERYRGEQARWLADDLRSSAARQARYRIVVSHIPPYESRQPATAGAAEGFAVEQVRKHWEPLANAGGVNLWLSGHTHRPGIVPPAAGRNRYHLIINAPDTLTRVEVSPQQLVVTITRETGEPLEKTVIRPSR
ncbi:MAG: metallophosphoesterase [Bacteroidales bacterium]